MQNSADNHLLPSISGNLSLLAYKIADQNVIGGGKSLTPKQD